MEMTGKVKTLHPDAKGRIALGALAVGVSSFRVTTDGEGKIILEPFVEIPAREQWLFKNKAALTQVNKGLGDSAEGKVSSLGDFTKYID